jgi:hypothetical protein
VLAFVKACLYNNISFYQRVMTMVFFDNEDVLRQQIRDHLIEYKTVNGFETVDDDYIRRLQSMDPVSLAEKITGSTVDEGAAGLSIMMMHMRRVIIEEITALTGDVNKGAPLTDYITAFENAGFILLHTWEYALEESGHFSSSDSAQSYLSEREMPMINCVPSGKGDGVKVNYVRHEKEVILYHHDYGFLIQMDSYEGKANSVSLMGEGVAREAVPEDYSLGMSGGYIPFTDRKEFSLSMLEIPMHKLTKLLTRYEPKKYWLSFCHSLYSSYSHKGVEVGESAIWARLLQDKLQVLPHEVLEKLLGKITYCHKEDAIMPMAVLVGNDEALCERAKALLTELEQRELSLRLQGFLGFDYPQYILSPALLEKAASVGLSDERVAHWLGNILAMVRNNNWDTFTDDEWYKVLCSFSKEQGAHLLEKLTESRKYGGLKEQAFEKLSLFLTTELTS